MFRLNIEIAGKADGDLAEQYKSRRNAYALCKQAEEHKLRFIHTYAPTAAFKTIADSQGIKNRFIGIIFFLKIIFFVIFAHITFRAHFEAIRTCHGVRRE